MDHVCGHLRRPPKATRRALLRDPPLRVTEMKVYPLDLAAHDLSEFSQAALPFPMASSNDTLPEFSSTFRL